MDRYRYLGIILNNILEFEVTASSLADAVNGGLGIVIGKTKHQSDLSVNTFEKLVTTELYQLCIMVLNVANDGLIWQNIGIDWLTYLNLG